MIPMVAEPVRVWNRLATQRDLSIGTFGASGSDGLWRVADFHVLPLQVYCADFPATGAAHEVTCMEQWVKLPDVGIEFVVYGGVNASSGHDEYLLQGNDPKYGLMLPEHEWRVIWHAAWGAIHREAARRDRDGD